ncbi:glutathione metabolism protein [Falsiroseomonas bella]|uniref:Glutathione metabolism protein n=1 Tax=Falsiroseomonas bella TaxID=2184016 RepID=A0A317FJG4_9PROT|nr:MAPEG family protein [Falsiroseomonas bella]PWS38763.1 glutathione metabolism protein [Falsiroseomonas bella]
MLPVTALYAGLLGLYFIWLATRVIKARRIHRVGLGTSHRLVERPARAHGNFAEYVPFALLLLALCEINGLPDWALHVLGVVLVAGRVLHAQGIAKEPEDFKWRVLGTSLTFTMMGVAAAALLGLAAATL